MASENGWEPLHPAADLLEWVTVPGTNVHLQFLKGQPLAILRAFAADFNAYIEPLRDADSAAYTATNSVSTSNHLNGTAMDLNWNSHEFRVLNAGFDAAKIATARELLAFYENTVWWGNDWNSPKDSMHWNMGYDTYGAQNVARVQSFIDRKIRSDGFSTFRRGGTVPVPPPVDESGRAADVLARATALTLQRANEILPAVISGLNASQCDNPNRVAMWLAQIGHESGSFKYTEEIQSGDESTDRWKYKGRTWIQITWMSNYSGFSVWCFGRNLVPTADYFVQRPRELADLKWAGLGAAWYWTVARTTINAMSDKRDLVGVTQAINGGQNGIADRRSRYDRALALGNDLLDLVSDVPLPPPVVVVGDDDLSAEAERQIGEIHAELTKLFASRSPLRHLGEGPIDTLAGFVLNADGSQHVEIVRLLASLGHPESLALLREVANNTAPDRQEDRNVALAILSELPDGTVEAPATAGPFTAAPQVLYQTPAAPVVGESQGAIIGRAYDALEALKNAQVSLSPESQAAMNALISVLQPKDEA